MKNRSALFLTSILMLVAGAAAAQWANPHPEAANVQYQRGDAPFYVRVRSYARHLERFFEPGNQYVVQSELSALDVDLAELEAINAVLSRYRGLEDEVRLERWRQECVPMLRGEPVTEEQARAAFERHDDEAWRAAVAEQVMAELATQRGAAVAGKVRQHIVERGESIKFSRNLMAKTIELGRGGLFVSHMMIECGTHPDYPPR